MSPYICWMFYIGFLSGSAFSIESGLAVPTWPCTRLPSRSLSASVGARGSRSLRSAERGVLVVPFARTAAMQNRAFSVADPKAWNDLPEKLHLFPRLCTDTFLGHLKPTFCPHWSWERF